MTIFCIRCGTQLQEKIIDNQKRLVCPSCGYINYQNAVPTVTAIIEKDGQVLMAKRAKDPYKGDWDLIGGFLEPNENFEQALIRETKEECNLDITSYKYYASFVSSYKNAIDGFESKTVAAIFLVEVTGNLKAGDDIKQCQWFYWDKLPDKIVGFEDVLAAIDKRKKEL